MQSNHVPVRPDISANQNPKHQALYDLPGVNVRTWSLLALLAVGLLALGLVVFGAPAGRGPEGILQPEHTAHDLGKMKVASEPVSARFVIAVNGAPVITELSTDLTCTQARIVQAGQTSEWFGFASLDVPARANVRLLPYQPGYLEVRLDPAVHGEGGAEPLQHSVRLKTSDGQDFTFTLAAEVER